MYKEIEGDLIEAAIKGEYDVIAHGCNCFNTMGAGIALTIKNIFPEAYALDRRTVSGDAAKLGTIVHTNPNVKPIVINCYTQYAFGSKTNPIAADYDAIRSCMKTIKGKFTGKKIGLPLIGAGLAGGDWEVIKLIIQEELIDEDVTVVIWNKK